MIYITDEIKAGAQRLLDKYLVSLTDIAVEYQTLKYHCVSLDIDEHLIEDKLKAVDCLLQECFNTTTVMSKDLDLSLLFPALIQHISHQSYFNGMVSALVQAGVKTEKACSFLGISSTEYILLRKNYLSGLPYKPDNGKVS